MYLKNINNSIIYNLNNVNYKKYYAVILIVFILLLFFLLIPYYEYYSYNLYIVDSKYTLVVDDNYFPAYNSLYINKIKYDYKIISISDYYLVDNKKYYEVVISIDLDENYIRTQNIIKVNIKKNKINLIKKLLRKEG